MKSMTNRLTAETNSRRSQFRQNETQPRLMRAMSAPIRSKPPQQQEHPHEKASNLPNQNVAKRRLRRKKIAPSEIDRFSIKITHDQQYMNKIVNQRSFDERFAGKQSLSSRTFKAVKSTKLAAPSRVKSASGGCEIETLVSLLSPGGSDSEKEDYANSNVDTPNERSHQSLRKVGKSGKIRRANISIPSIETETSRHHIVYRWMCFYM